MTKSRFILPACCLMLSFVFAQAQPSPHQWEFKVNAAYNIGGSSPLPLPVEIRKIESFEPAAFSPHLAAEVIYRFDSRWGVSAQLALDYKGFTVKNRVKNLHTEIEMGEEMYIGNFTGKNTSIIKNYYLSIPVLANYRLSERWDVQLGPYFAWLCRPYFQGNASDGYIRQGSPIGEKTIVDKATFDFSDSQNKFDFGLLAAAEWGFYRNLALRGQLAWGLRPLFPSDFTGISFKMYNIYASIGLSYRLSVSSEQ